MATTMAMAAPPSESALSLPVDLTAQNLASQQARPRPEMPPESERRTCPIAGPPASTCSGRDQEASAENVLGRRRSPACVSAPRIRGSRSIEPFIDPPDRAPHEQLAFCELKSERARQRKRRNGHACGANHLSAARCSPLATRHSPLASRAARASSSVRPGSETRTTTLAA